jgi:hypothetical protein
VAGEFYLSAGNCCERIRHPLRSSAVEQSIRRRGRGFESLLVDSQARTCGRRSACTLRQIEGRPPLAEAQLGFRWDVRAHDSPRRGAFYLRSRKPQRPPIYFKVYDFLPHDSVSTHTGDTHERIIFERVSNRASYSHFIEVTRRPFYFQGAASIMRTGCSTLA